MKCSRHLTENTEVSLARSSETIRVGRFAVVAADKRFWKTRLVSVVSRLLTSLREWRSLSRVAVVVAQVHVVADLHKVSTRHRIPHFTDIHVTDCRFIVQLYYGIDQARLPKVHLIVG